MDGLAGAGHGAKTAGLARPKGKEADMSDLDRSATSERQIPLTAKIVVSLKAGALLAAANIVCVLIFSWAWVHVKAEPKMLSVTGSAKRQITSDLIVWRAKVSVIEPDLVAAYAKLKRGMDQTLSYLKQQGVPESQVTVSSIGTWKRRERDAKGNETEKIVSYELWQTVQVSSSEVAQVAEVGRKITSLIEAGIMLESEEPKYLYTKMADLKVVMLAEATKDAAVRAQQIAGNSGAKLGPIAEARMGVMQINAVHDDEVSGAGVNDTSSLDKEITAVVSAKFALE
jgi:hypothetical protein